MTLFRDRVVRYGVVAFSHGVNQMRRSTRRPFLVAGIALALAAGTAVPAAAQMACGMHNEIVTQLNADYSEQLKSAGLTADGKLFELFASDQGSWTVLITHPNGAACLVLHGENLEALPTPVKGRTS